MFAIPLFLGIRVDVKRKIIRRKSLQYDKPGASVLPPAVGSECVADLKSPVPAGRMKEPARISRNRFCKKGGPRRFAHGTVPFATCDSGAGQFILVSVSTHEQIATRTQASAGESTVAYEPADSPWCTSTNNFAHRVRSHAETVSAANHHLSCGDAQAESKRFGWVARLGLFSPGFLPKYPCTSIPPRYSASLVHAAHRPQPINN